MEAFTRLSDHDRAIAAEALLLARLALTHAGEPFSDGEPGDIDVSDDTVTILFEDAAYVWDRAEREVLRMRHARCHDNCRAFTEFGRAIAVPFQIPIGNPQWN